MRSNNNNNNRHDAALHAAADLKARVFVHQQLEVGGWSENAN